MSNVNNDINGNKEYNHNDPSLLSLSYTIYIIVNKTLRTQSEFQLDSIRFAPLSSARFKTRRMKGANFIIIIYQSLKIK